MEPPPTEAATSSDDAHDPRLDELKRKYTRLSEQIRIANNQYVPDGSKALCNVFKLIEGTYFYESLAQFGFNTRLNHFYSSLQIGDRFVAKVISVFERSADVLLIWSPKRDICDLKIKAYLRLVEQKRYSNNGDRNSKYFRQERNVILDKNIDVSELIFVELIQVNQTNRKIEVFRCKSLTDENILSEDNDEEDGLLNEERYRSKSPSQTSFHEYMLDHDHLRNPSLLKQPFFTSLMRNELVIESYNRKLKEKQTSATKNDEEVVLLEVKKGNKQTQSSENGLPQNTVSLKRSDSFKATNSRDNSCYSHEETSARRKRNHKSLSSDILNSVADTPHLLRKSSSSSSASTSSSSSSSTSNSDSSSSGEEYHKRHKRKHKSNHEGKRHKKRSKKHSKKIKKKKHKKCKDRVRYSSSSSGKKKKIDDKILKLLKYT